MHIAIIGGTGKEGSGLAVRWANKGHEVHIGSRNAERGVERAKELSEEYNLTIHGGGNEDILSADGIDLVVLSVPYSAHAATLESHKEQLQNARLLDITVPLQPPKVRQVHLPSGGSAAVEAQAILGDGAQVAAAFHHVSYTHLLDLENDLETDVLVVADKLEFRKDIMQLVRDAGGRPVNAGVLRNATALEALTPVLIHINGAYKIPGAGIRITGLPE